MQKLLLSLLTILNLSTAQSTSESWGTPFSVDGPSTAGSNPDPSASTEALITSAIDTPLTHPLLPTDSAGTPVMPSSQSDVSLIEGTRQPSGLSSFTATLPRPTGSGMSMSSTTGRETAASTGGAPAMPTGYVRLGVAGALAGAAGVLFV